MWVLGLVIGALSGGAIGGGAGAVVGAVLGGIAGWMFSDAARAANQRYTRLEALVSQISDRVTVLEERIAEARKPDATPVSAYRETPLPESISETGSPLSSASSDTTTGPLEDVPFATAEQLPPSSEFEPPPEPEPQTARVESFPHESPPAPPQSSALWNFFFGGNTLVRFGVIVLFFGVAFLLKYASERIEIPIEARLIGVALGAIVMLAIGWRLRYSRPGYGLIMQGGGIGVLYLTVFAAFRLYQLLPGGLVFALLAAMSVFSAVMAVLQDSRSLAAMSVSGGFLAPVLASTGSGSHVALFSFYALINLGILMIAWFKPWRSLNMLGFAFTFIIGLLWGERYYRSEFLASTEPFLLLFFLFYVVIAVLFALRQEVNIKSPVDGTLVFGTPLVAFGLQTALVRDIEYAAAFSALALSCFYLLLAKYLFSRVRANIRLLVEAFLALGVVFATLAVPLALDGRWTAAAWALEGAAIVWIGARQDKPLARAFGIFLQFAAGVAFFLDASGSRGALPVFNSFYLGCVFISAAALFCAWYIKRRRTQLTDSEGIVAIALFCWGSAWWLGAGLLEIHERVTFVYRLHASLLFITTSCAAFSILHRRINWLEARYAALALLPLMVIAAAAEVDRAAHPFKYLGFIAWPIAFGANLWIMRRHEDTRHIGAWHAAGAWLFAALGAWETAWWIGDLIRGGDVWRLIGWPLVPIVLLAWLSDRGERTAWPVARHLEAYLFDGAIVLAAFLWLWMLYTNFNSRGDPLPLPYLPLLNPLDLTQGAALLALFTWFRRVRSAPFAPQLFQSPELAYVALGSIAFLWLNGVLLRTLHHWAGVPFDFDVMMRSMLVQASLSIFWSVLALCIMLAATRLRARSLWLTGAGLMAVVVVKLFFVDLSNIGGIERVVSFIGVGALMLVIGYVSPVPPASLRGEK
jgi:uncharacterized membrane protein